MAVPKFTKANQFKRAHRSKDNEATKKKKRTADNRTCKTHNKQFSSISSKLQFDRCEHGSRRTTTDPVASIIVNNDEKNKTEEEIMFAVEEKDLKDRRAKMMIRAKKRITRCLMVAEYNTSDSDKNNRNNNNDDKYHEKLAELRDKDASIQDIRMSQLDLGRILGKGAFAEVRVVNFINRKNNSGKNDIPDEEGETACFVAKMLRSDLLETKKDNMLTSIAADLVKEAIILAGLSKHQNVLQLAGYTKNGIYGFIDVAADYKELLRPDGFVLVLERLSGSLTEKFSEWRQCSKQNKHEHVPDIIMMPHLHHHQRYSITNSKGCIHHPVDHHPDALWIERLDVLKQLAHGIEYLHANRIIHRDLKPDNLGFDCRNPNTLKIFDFNVARKLPPSKNNNELFRLTQNVGSRRYMAPEVGMKKLYNQQVDVYAFGLLAYQVLALPSSDKVFPDILTVEKHKMRVFHKGQRPVVPRSWPSELCKMIERSWSGHIQERPSAKELKDFFEAEIAKNKLSIEVSPTTTIKEQTAKSTQERGRKLYKPRTRFGRIMLRTLSRHDRQTQKERKYEEETSSSIIDSSFSSSSCWSSSLKRDNDNCTNATI